MIRRTGFLYIELKKLTDVRISFVLRDVIYYHRKKNLNYSFKYLWLQPLCEKCPNTELFLVRIFLYSDWIRENKDQKNSVFGHFSHSDRNIISFCVQKEALYENNKIIWLSFPYNIFSSHITKIKSIQFVTNIYYIFRCISK